MGVDIHNDEALKDKLEDQVAQLKQIIGLEKTLDMMCDVSQKSPSCLLQAFQPLRLPWTARKVFNEVVTIVKRPSKLAFGMLVTSLNVINVFTDEFDAINPQGKSNFQRYLSLFIDFEILNQVVTCRYLSNIQFHYGISFDADG